MRELAEEESESAAEDRTSGNIAARVDALMDRRFEGLDPRFHAVLAELLMRPAWSSADFEALVRRHKLMPSGTIDTINEWAQDRFDDLIIENGGDDLTVNTNLIRE